MAWNSLRFHMYIFYRIWSDFTEYDRNVCKSHLQSHSTLPLYTTPVTIMYFTVGLKRGQRYRISLSSIDAILVKCDTVNRVPVIYSVVGMISVLLFVRRAPYDEVSYQTDSQSVWAWWTVISDTLYIWSGKNLWFLWLLGRWSIGQWPASFQPIILWVSSYKYYIAKAHLKHEAMKLLGQC